MAQWQINKHDITPLDHFEQMKICQVKKKKKNCHPNRCLLCCSQFLYQISFTWKTKCESDSSSLSRGASSCNDFSFRKKVFFPLGKIRSRKMSTLGSPAIGNSLGIVSWLIAKNINNNFPTLINHSVWVLTSSSALFDIEYYVRLPIFHFTQT